MYSGLVNVFYRLAGKAPAAPLGRSKQAAGNAARRPVGHVPSGLPTQRGDRGVMTLANIPDIRFGSFLALAPLARQHEPGIHVNRP
ncbi:hypothetical protein PAN31117_04456 [Pandoraea anapnoica]|uniref:Uncharacterized protein n=1 Tax=Pandoraea anapnoica TaxID=2508301 RepID=A0A5E5AIG6_9BURK|nr:hypothetical protein PAN31117_04456 [Pandoraea anapnoica]